MTGTRLRRALAALVVALLGSIAAGCSYGDSLRPAAVGAGQYRIDAVFEDALNLPAGAPVKVGGVAVGKVVAVQPDDYRARVQMAVDDDVRIPRGSTFRLRYTTALGELYVEVTPAADGPPIEDASTIEGANVYTAPTVEDSLASASLLVNGGSLGQIQTIVTELNHALDGRLGACPGETCPGPFPGSSLSPSLRETA